MRDKGKAKAKPAGRAKAKPAAKPKAKPMSGIMAKPAAKARAKPSARVKKVKPKIEKPPKRKYTKRAEKVEYVKLPTSTQCTFKTFGIGKATFYGEEQVNFVGQLHLALRYLRDENKTYRTAINLLDKASR